MSTHLDELIHRWREGSLTEEELHHLNEALTTPEGRATMRGDWFLEASIPEALRTTRLLKAVEPPQTIKWAAWLSWRPLTAAAAGLAIGLFSASMVFAFVAQHGAMEQRWPLALTDGGFESLDSTPQPNFVPVRENVWSGDFTSLSEGEKDVSPCEGRRMLKFLRADNLQSPPQASRAASEVWQVVNVAKLRATLGRDLQTLELSARFNQANAAAGEPTAFGVSVVAFVGAPAEAPAVWRNRHELALAESGKKETADGDTLSWQRVAAQITVPKEATHLLLYLRATRKSPEPHSVEFGRHFADDVRLTAIESTPAVATK
jgi:hypothetical protein